MSADTSESQEACTLHRTDAPVVAGPSLHDLGIALLGHRCGQLRELDLDPSHGGLGGEEVVR